MLIALSSTSKNFCGSRLSGDAEGVGGRGVERGDSDGDLARSRVRSVAGVSNAPDPVMLRMLNISLPYDGASSPSRFLDETRCKLRGAMWLFSGGSGSSCLSTHRCNAAMSILASFRGPVLESLVSSSIILASW